MTSTAAPGVKLYKEKERELSSDDNTRGLPSEHDRGEQAGEDVLAIALGEMARELQNQTPHELLMAIAEAAVSIIPGAEHSSISLVEGRRTVTPKAPTSELPTRVDEIQTAESQGPCLDAIYEQKTVRIPDMRTATRWPDFARRAAAETPIRSMLAFQLFVEAETLGALNIFSSRPQAFSDESEHVELIVAAHAAVALAGSQEVSQLHSALVSRDMIGMAKGILMERYRIDEHKAFLLLVKVSNVSNIELHEQAERLVYTGYMDQNLS